MIKLMRVLTEIILILFGAMLLFWALSMVAIITAMIGADHG